jgi:hypothetical protein
MTYSDLARRMKRGEAAAMRELLKIFEALRFNQSLDEDAIIHAVALQRVVEALLPPRARRAFEIEREVTELRVEKFALETDERGRLSQKSDEAEETGREHKLRGRAKRLGLELQVSRYRLFSEEQVAWLRQDGSKIDMTLDEAEQTLNGYVRSASLIKDED